MRDRVFKFCTHFEKGQVYCGKENQDAVVNFCLLFQFFLFSISHSSIHIESGEVYCVTENQTEIYSAFFFLFSISHSSVIHREICDKYFSGTIAHRIL